MKFINKIQNKIIGIYMYSSISILIISLAYNTNSIGLKPSAKSSSLALVFESVPEDKRKEAYDVVLNAYRTIQAANTKIFYLAVIAFVLFTVLLIVGNKSRKKFYISNLIAGIAVPVISIGFAIVSLLSNLNAKSVFNSSLHYSKISMDYYKVTYSVLPMNFASVLIIIFIIVSAMVLAYTVAKYILSSKENKKVGA